MPQQRLDLAQKSGLRIGLWDWDTVANTVTWSDETYSQFGFTRDTFSGRVEDAVSRIHLEDRPRVEAAIQKVLAGTAPEYAEQYRVVRPDGSICWIDAPGVLIENGRHMIGTGVDITGLKESRPVTRSKLGPINPRLSGQITLARRGSVRQMIRPNIRD